MHLKRPLIIALVLAATLVPACGPSVETGTVQEQLQEGWRRYSTGSFEFAVDQFKYTLRQPGLTEQDRYSALLGLATTYHYDTNSDLGAARAHYEKLLELPLEAARRQALLGLGLVDLEDGKVESGRMKLMELAQQYPQSLEADEATLHLADSLLHPRGPEEEEDPVGGFVLPAEAAVRRGMEILEERLSEHPDNSLAALMHLRLAHRYIEREAWRDATEHLKQALAKGITSSRTRSSAMWSIARIAEKELQDYALAAEYYEAFTNETKRHVLYYRAMQSLERMKERLQQAEVESG